MSTRLVTVPPTGRSVVDPVPRSILTVDVEGSTLRTNPMKGELRRIMYALLYRALRAIGIDHEHLENPVDRGDGVMLLFRPDDDVPKTLLLGQLIPKLAALLVEHNATVGQPDLRLRLRVVFHAGEVHDDGWGFYGEDIDVACRLLDSPSVKQALKDAASSALVLVVSEEIRAAIVRHGYVDVGPQVRSVSVRVAERQRRGWVHIPVPAAAEHTLPVGRPRTPLRATSLAIAAPPQPPEAATAPDPATAEEPPLVSANAL
jgi:hypothetical protein